MIDFFLICLILLIGYFFSSALKARETALYAVKAHCQHLELQMLDEYVALTALWLKRDNNKKLQAWRSYTFEFSATGLERYQGKIIMLGSNILAIQLDPYREE